MGLAYSRLMLGGLWFTLFLMLLIALAQWWRNKAAALLVSGAVPLVAVFMLDWWAPKPSNERPFAKLIVTKALMITVQNENTRKLGLAVNVFLNNVGSAPAFGEVHGASFAVTKNELPRSALLGYMQNTASFDATQALRQNADPIYPNSPEHFFTVPSNDESMGALSGAFEDFMSGSKIIYIFVVIKYRDQETTSKVIGISEMCGWFNKDALDVVHYCGINRVSWEIER